MNNYLTDLSNHHELNTIIQGYLIGSQLSKFEIDFFLDNLVKIHQLEEESDLVNIYYPLFESVFQSEIITTVEPTKKSNNELNVYPKAEPSSDPNPELNDKPNDELNYEPNAELKTLINFEPSTDSNNKVNDNPCTEQFDKQYIQREDKQTVEKDTKPNTELNSQLINISDSQQNIPKENAVSEPIFSGSLSSYTSEFCYICCRSKGPMLSVFSCSHVAHRT